MTHFHHLHFTITLYNVLVTPNFPNKKAKRERAGQSFPRRIGRILPSPLHPLADGSPNALASTACSLPPFLEVSLCPVETQIHMIIHKEFSPTLLMSIIRGARLLSEASPPNPQLQGDAWRLAR